MSVSIKINRYSSRTGREITLSSALLFPAYNAFLYRKQMATEKIPKEIYGKCAISFQRQPGVLWAVLNEDIFSRFFFRDSELTIGGYMSKHSTVCCTHTSGPLWSQF